MSDFFDDSLEDTFDSDIYIRKLCENTKLTIQIFDKAIFPVGWKNIVDELIQTIKNYPVIITRISESFSLLEVKFEIERPTKEVCVWRAIDKARMDSACTCALCGEQVRFRSKTNMSELLCLECKKTAGKLGKTQTWLDKY